MRKKKPEINYYCDACGKLIASHLGLIGTCAQYQQVKILLRYCAPHVFAAAKAEHLLDGFNPRKRKIDKLVEEIRKALKK